MSPSLEMTSITITAVGIFDDMTTGIIFRPTHNHLMSFCLLTFTSGVILFFIRKKDQFGVRGGEVLDLWEIKVL